MKDRTDIFDITFVGGGPVGLYGTFYSGNRGLKAKIIDTQVNLGGRLTSLYPDKTIYDVAGHPKILARDFIEQLVKQASRSKPAIHTGEKVDLLQQKDETIWKLRTEKGEHSSRTVVIAAGAGAFVPRGLDLLATSSLVGKGVHYIVDDLEQFRNKRVIIFGAGDNALDWALRLKGVAERVTLVHRLNKFGADEMAAGELAESGIEALFPYYELKELHGENRVEAVTFINTNTGEEERREVDAVVLNIGFLVNLSDFEMWGLKVSGNAIDVNERMETNLPGVYAAGDVATHPGKLKLISTGAAEAAIAVESAARELARRGLAESRRAAGIERVMESGKVFFSGFEAVQMAIALVRASVEFFQLAFFSTRNSVTKQIFAELQKDGHKHLKLLRDEVLPLFSGTGYQVDDLDGTALAYLADSIDPFVFGGFRLARKAQQGLASDLEAVYVGIRVHEDVIAFLNRLADEESFVGVKRIIHAIADNENRHLEMLRLQQRELMEKGIGV